MWNRVTIKVAAAAFLLTVPAAQIWAEELSDAKKADLKTFIDIMGVKGLPMAMANSQTQQMAQGLRQVDPKFPDKGLQIMRDQMASVLNENAGKPNGLYDQVALVYHNNFTHDELKEIIRFQQSPAGKKFGDTQQKVGQEMMMTAGKWASQFAPEIDKRIKEALAAEKIKFPEPKAAPAPKPAASTKPPAGDGAKK